MAQLVVYFFILSLFAAGLVAYVSWRQSKAVITLSLYDRMDAVADIKATELDHWVDAQLQNIALLAQEPEMRREIDLLFNAPPDSADYRVAHDSILYQLGKIIVEQKGFEEVFILGLENGRIRLSTSPAHEDEIRGADLYFVEGREAKFIQGVYRSELTEKPTLTVAAPLFNEQGERIGVIAAHLDLTTLDQIILNPTGLGELGETGDMYLVDTAVRFVSQERLLEQGDRAVNTVAVQRALEGNAGHSLYENYDGTAVIGAYRWLENVKAAHLTEMTQEEAFAPARQLALTILLTGISAAIFLAIGVYFFSRRIAGPILAITESAAAIEAESESFNPQTLAPIAKREDELGRLARVFQRMAREVYTREETLKKEVRALRIKIDESKRSKQVEEITDTEFFRELQANAEKMRQRNKKRTS